MKLVLIIVSIFIILVIWILSLNDENISKQIQGSIWKERKTGDIVKIISMTHDNVWYTYIDENGNDIGTPGNVDFMWFMKNFKLKK